MIGTAPRDGPGITVVAPFFVVAPIGLVAAGLLLATAGEDVLLAVNTPQLVAVTHATVLGWLTLSIMGAVYQLGPAVFGGRLVSKRLVGIQFVVHVASVTTFIAAVQAWNVPLMGVAAIGVVTSLVLFLVNALPASRWFHTASLPQLYVSVAILFLGATAVMGITFVGALEHLWFPITQGRLSGHAHLGLVGWLALMLMGVSYQLTPMFHVAPRAVPRFGRLALVFTSLATITAFVGFSMDPDVPVRVVLAVFLSTGPILWMLDTVHMLRKRSRRHMDIHGHALVASMVFLSCTIVIGMLSATGTRFAPSGEPARLLLAYGTLGIGGWAGTLLIGNSAKIVPFLVWNSRYRALAGLTPVPGVADLSYAGLAHTTLVTLSSAVVVIAAGALLGELVLIRAGGLLLAASGACHCATLLAIIFMRPTTSAQKAPFQGPVNT